MHIEEAKSLLGFPPDSHPSVSQVKAAYKTKVWDTHPDRFPPHQRSGAEHQFKLISEAYSCLRYGPKLEDAYRASYSHVVRTGVPRGYVGRGNHVVVGFPFLLIILGTIALGGTNATRAYRREKEAHASHNPFLP